MGDRGESLREGKIKKRQEIKRMKEIESKAKK